jgi:hypothetical protein
LGRGLPVNRDESRQEVLTVNNTITNERPSTLLAVCAPVSGVWSSSASFVAHENVGQQAVRVSPTADTSQLPAAHRIQGQAKPAQARNQRTAESYESSKGTNGSRGKGVVPMSKKLVDDARGVPPRGRPV